ncbi:MAG: hypothetical protein EOM87_01245 [Clostridia bacterium]|nr:hypothetical protein [Clostridia bacterium]
MPAKKGDNTGSAKSYKDRQSKAQIDDIISQFGFEEVAAPKAPKASVAKDIETKNNVINNDDEYDLDGFDVGVKETKRETEPAYDFSSSGLSEEPKEKEDTAFNNDDEYGVSDMEFFNAPEQSNEQIKQNALSFEEEEKPSATDNNSETDSIAKSKEFFDDNVQLSSGFLVDPEPDTDTEPQEETVYEVKPDSYAPPDKEFFANTPVKEEEIVMEVQIESENIEFEEMTIDIEPEEIKQDELEENGDIKEYANIDNDFMRPMKRAKQEIMGKQKKNVENKKELKETLVEAPVAVAVPAAAPIVAAATATPVHKSKMHFVTPKNAREYAKLRKKYKINKDPIFCENDYVDGFILANNEILLKRYDALKVNGGNVGRILITNKRMLFNTSEKAEIPLDEVIGIRSAHHWTLSWVKLIFSMLLIAAAAFAFVYDFTSFSFIADKAWLVYIIIGLGAVFALIGVILLFTFARKRFALKIFIHSAYEFITYNSKKKKKENAIMQSVIIAMPGKELDKFVREVGALILQSREGFFN